MSMAEMSDVRGYDDLSRQIAHQKGTVRQNLKRVFWACSIFRGRMYGRLKYLNIITFL